MRPAPTSFLARIHRQWLMLVVLAAFVCGDLGRVAHLVLEAHRPCVEHGVVEHGDIAHGDIAHGVVEHAVSAHPAHGEQSMLAHVADEHATDELCERDPRDEATHDARAVPASETPAHEACFALATSCERGFALRFELGDVVVRSVLVPVVAPARVLVDEREARHALAPKHSPPSA